MFSKKIKRGFYSFWIALVLIWGSSCSNSTFEENYTKQTTKLEPKDVVSNYITLSKQEGKEEEIKNLAFNYSTESSDFMNEKTNNVKVKNTNYNILMFSKILRTSYNDIKIVRIEQQNLNEDKAEVIAIVNESASQTKDSMIRFILQKQNDDWKIIHIPVL